MDENIKLMLIRELVKGIRTPDSGALTITPGVRLDWGLQLANAVAELDMWLREGGMIPLDWLPPEAGGTGKSAS